MKNPLRTAVNTPANARPDRGWSWKLEISLWCMALACSAVVVSGRMEVGATQRIAQAIAPPSRSRPADLSRDLDSPLPPRTPVVSGSGAVIGRLEIPNISLSVPILENYDPATLKRGVGHIPGTAFPGGLGNLGLAGHRDTFFRPLRKVRKGMEVDVVTPAGTYRYQIDLTEIVTPDQVQVLDIRGRPELTLITCYPFDFIGAAPQRFIVHARLLSLEPS